MYQLPDELKQKIAENPVDDMPISDRIYERIFNQIVIKTEDEQNDVEQTASDSFDF